MICFSVSAKPFQLDSAFWDSGCPCQVLDNTCKYKYNLKWAFHCFDKNIFKPLTSTEIKDGKVNATDLIRDWSKKHALGHGWRYGPFETLNHKNYDFLQTSTILDMTWIKRSLEKGQFACHEC